MNDAEGKLATEFQDFADLGFAPSIIAAAHELKSPLILLRQLTFQFEEENLQPTKTLGVKNVDLEKNQEIIRRMKFTVERALRLSDNLTRAARLEDAMFTLEPVQLAGLCESVINEMLPLGKELHTKIVFKKSRSSHVVIGNRELLYALLIGLLDNALYHSDGKEVKVFTQTSKKEAVLSVCDYGEVIDLGEFRKLKKTLGQAKMPISSRPMSSGLGLVIAQKFATAMNGRLSVKRRTAGGMVFSVHLPISHQLSLLEL